MRPTTTDTPSPTLAAAPTVAPMVASVTSKRSSKLSRPILSSKKHTMGPLAAPMKRMALLLTKRRVLPASVVPASTRRRPLRRSEAPILQQDRSHYGVVVGSRSVDLQRAGLLIFSVAVHEECMIGFE